MKIFTRLYIPVLLLLTLGSLTAHAQDVREKGSQSQAGKGTVTGTVTDKETGDPLVGASVVVTETTRGTRLGGVTGEEGKFSIRNVPAGTYKVEISYLGYSAGQSEIGVSADQTADAGKISMEETQIIGETVVVSASRRPEKLTEAPSSISVITNKDLDQLSSFNVGELASKLQGVEFVRIGVNGTGINARGFNNAFNAKILALNDGRNGMLPGGSGLPLGLVNTVIKEDVERVEVVLGPSSALYGPNAHNGVVNTITKDPRIFQGTTITFGAGNQGVYSLRMRNARKLSDRWAYKITAEYTEGYDFSFRDSIFAGASGAPVRVVPERLRDSDFKFRHIKGEGHVYYSINDKWTIIGSYGASRNDYLTVNNVGRNRIDGLQFFFTQLRVTSPRFYASINNAWLDFGNSFSINSYTADYFNRTNTLTARGTTLDPVLGIPTTGLLTAPEAEAFGKRPGNSFQEYSQRLQADAQYNHSIFGFQFIVGFNYQLDRPNTFGTSLADGINPTTLSAKLIRIEQIGGAIQVERKLPFLDERIKVFAAARLDNHNVFGNLFAPKGGVTIQALSGTFRATVGRALAAPIILFQSANLLNGLAFGNGPGVQYIPNGAAATSAPISTDPLKPEDITTYEVGYKGVLVKKLFLDVSAYYGDSKNFLSPLIAVSGRAVSVGDIPVTPAFGGVVDVSGNVQGASFFTYFNYGRIASYGVDLGINYYFNNYINAGLKYSYFDSDITKVRFENDANRDGYVSAEERSLNAPRNRIVLNIGFQNLLNKKLYANITIRWVEAFNFYSGNQIGDDTGNFLQYSTTSSFRGGLVRNDPANIVDPTRFYGTFPTTTPLAQPGSRAGIDLGFLPNSYTQARLINRGKLGGFTTVDLSVGYSIMKEITIGASVSNLFDTDQREFVGSPLIRRLIAGEVRFNLP